MPFSGILPLMARAKAGDPHGGDLWTRINVVTKASSPPASRLKLSYAEKTLFSVCGLLVLVLIIVSLSLAQVQLVREARQLDLDRVERYISLCRIKLEAQGRGAPDEKNLRELEEIGLYIDVFPPSQEIPEQNPRYVLPLQSVEAWDQVRGPDGKIISVIRIGRYDSSTRIAVKAVRLYTLLSVLSAIIVAGAGWLIVRRMLLRPINKLADDVEARGSRPLTLTTDNPLERLTHALRADRIDQQQAAARVQQMLDGHSELACRQSTDGTLAAVNAAYGRLFAKKPEELVGTNCLDLIPPADRTDALNSLRKLSRRIPSNIVEHRVLLADGSTRWMRWRDTAVLHEDGTLKEVLSYGSDITPEKDLATRIDGLKVAFDQMQSLAETGSLTWDLAADVMEWTPETRRLLGVDASAPASLDGLLAVVAPDEMETVRRLFLEAKERGRDFQHEFRAVLPDGSLRSLQSRAEVLADPKTKILNHLTCTLRDITALRDAEAATKRELRFREAIEQSLTAGILVSDDTGRNLLVNPAFCAMTGWSREELVGVTAPYPYWPEEDTPAITKAFEMAITGQTPRDGFELRFRRKDGTRFDVLIKVAPLLESEDRRIGWLGAVTDISAIQQTRRELQATNERLRIAQDVAEFGIWDWNPVKDTLHWDRQSFALFGYPDATDPKEVWVKANSDEEQERLTYELKRLIANGGTSGQDRLRVQWPDGSIHDILSTYVIIRDEAGHSTRVLGINRDVTTELEEEREFRSAQERLAAALEGGSFGTFEHLFGVGALNWNTANYELYGVDPGITDPEELFQAWKAIAGPEYAALEQKISGLPVSKNVITYIFSITVPGTGEKRRINSSVFVERNKKGHPLRLVGISRRLD
jgi:PAS domain S-box-containing protein